MECKRVSAAIVMLIKEFHDLVFVKPNNFYYITSSSKFKTLTMIVIESELGNNRLTI
jgi:hypothetical protein